MTRLDLIQRLPAGTVGAEIGVYRGDFSAAILSTQVNQLYLVDCWEHQGGEYRFDAANVDQGGQDMNERIVRSRFNGDHRVVILKGYSHDIAHLFKKHPAKFSKLDWVYIDGDHTFKSVTRDLQMWGDNVKRGGLIFCHDYHITEETEAAHSQVKQAVDHFCLMERWRVMRVTDEPYPTCVLKEL